MLSKCALVDVSPDETTVIFDFKLTSVTDAFITSSLEGRKVGLIPWAQSQGDPQRSHQTAGFDLEPRRSKTQSQLLKS